MRRPKRNSYKEFDNGKDVNSIINPLFWVYCSLLGCFYLFFFVLKTSKKRKKKWSSTEQASNEAVAKKSCRYPFANPNSIYIYTVSLTVKIKEIGKPASFYKDR